MEKGLNIKIARIKASVKAIDLANQLSISPSKLSLIENGHIECPEKLYQKLETILGVNQ